MKYDLCREERSAALLELMQRLQGSLNAKQMRTKRVEERFEETENYLNELVKRSAEYMALDGEYSVSSTEALFGRTECFELRMPYTKEEIAMFLQADREGYWRLFFNAETWSIVRSNLNAYMEQTGMSEEDVTALDDFLAYKGRSMVREQWTEVGEDYYDTVKLLLTTVQWNKTKKAGERVRLLQRREENGKLVEILYPCCVSYSQLEERLRLLAEDINTHQIKRYYISEVIGVDVVEERYVYNQPEMKAIIVRVEDCHNAVERFLSRIMEYQYYLYEEKGRDAVFCLFFYPEYDRSRVVTRLLYMGENVEVLGSVDKRIETLRHNLSHSDGKGRWPASMTTVKALKEEGDIIIGEILGALEPKK